MTTDQGPGSEHNSANLSLSLTEVREMSISSGNSGQVLKWCLCTVLEPHSAAVFIIVEGARLLPCPESPLINGSFRHMN